MGARTKLHVAWPRTRGIALDATCSLAARWFGDARLQMGGPYHSDVPATSVLLRPFTEEGHGSDVTGLPCAYVVTRYSGRSAQFDRQLASRGYGWADYVRYIMLGWMAAKYTGR